MTIVWLNAVICAQAVDFEKEIKPIFDYYCLECHGPEKQKSDLRLDQRAILMRGGNAGLPSIIPGDPIKSHLVELIKSTDSEERMPPKGKPLESTEIALVERWISEGAIWPGQMNQIAKMSTDHWSFQPVSLPTPPSSGSTPLTRFWKQSSTNLTSNPMNQQIPWPWFVEHPLF